MASRWELILEDRMSGPARTAANALGRLFGAVRSLKDGAGSLGGSLAGLRGSLTGVGDGFDEVKKGAQSAIGGSLVSMAGGAVRAVGRISMALGESVVSLASFRESSLTALEAVTGSAETAGRSFRNSLVIANQTPGDTQDVAAMSQRFMVAGFSERETTPMLAASADLSAAFGRQQADSFALVASQMRAAGRMDRGDLRQLLNAGVNTGDVLDSIARQLHLQGATETARRQAALKAITDHRVNGDVGNQAALDAISHRLNGGGALGGFARRQSETLTGALSNARNAWDNLVLGMDTASMPGLVAFKDAVLAVTHGFEASQPAGRELRGIVGDIVDTVGVGLFGEVNADTMQRVADTLRDVRPTLKAVAEGVAAFGQGFGSGFMDTLGPVLEGLSFFSDGEGTSTADAMRALGSALGWFAAVVVLGFGAIGVGISGIVQMFTDLPDDLGFVWDQLGAWFSELPGHLVDGFLGTLHAEWARIMDDMGFLASQLPEPIKRALGIHSPSRVMMELGAYTAEGFALGVDSGAGRAGRSMESLVEVPTAAARAGVAGRGGVTIESLSVVVQAREGEDPEALGERVGAGVLARLADALGILNAGPEPA